ncbi:hypothetical protein BHE74_00027047 [Ensete ventricosum]|nr:hypothetical protein BHE74_00027047 [Ensete ventricosum]
MAALRLWTGESSRAWEDMGAALLPPQWSSHNRGVGAVGAADHSQLSGGGLDMDGPRSFDCSTLPCLTHQWVLVLVLMRRVDSAFKRSGYKQGSPYRVVRPRTARYILVQQLTGTRTGRYWVVPLKSIVGDRFRLSAVDFDRRRSIDGEIGHWRSIEEEKGKRRKKKKYLTTVLACALPMRPSRPQVTR